MPENWSSPLYDRIPLLASEIHLYLLDFEATEPLIKHLEQFLTIEEITIARDYTKSKNGHEFIFSRATLRLLLGFYLGTNPQIITFVHNQAGKPFLKNQPIQFNISHTDRYALFGFSIDRQIGVDLEKIRNIKDFKGVSAEFMNESEIMKLAKLNENAQTQAFFKTWTRKEALSKALGHGMRFPFKSVQIEINPDQAPKILTEEWATAWHLEDIPLPIGWVGAIAYNLPMVSIKKLALLESNPIAQLLKVVGKY